MECVRIGRKRQYRNNPEGFAARRHKWAAKNAERVRTQQKRYRSQQQAQIRVAEACRKYSLTREQTEDLMARQSCDVCGKPFGAIRNGRHIEHDHVSGRVRGVVHPRCNIAIGVVEEPGLLNAVVAYLTQQVGR